MITLTKQSWGLIPFEQAAPHDNHNIIVFLSPKTALLISDIKNFKGERLSIGKIMTSEEHRDIFFTEEELVKMRNNDPAEIYKERLHAFAAEMQQKIERYFITKKMPRYIYYDEKEQDLLKLLFSSAPLTCNISLMSSKGGWHMIPFDNLKPEGYNNLRNMLGPITLQAEIPLESYLRLKNVHIKPKRDIDKVTSDRILEKYESLNVSDYAEYKKAKKNIQKSLHPDVGGSAVEFDEFVKSIEQLEKTKWFKSLKGGK